MHQKSLTNTYESRGCNEFHPLPTNIASIININGQHNKAVSVGFEGDRVVK